MPYIDKEARKHFEPALLSSHMHLSNRGWKKGDFNFFVSTLIHQWIKEKGISYDTLSDITGVLNDIKTELERQVFAPYEDQKIAENGAVYNIDQYMIDKRRKQHV